jgi:hypothetical protein
VIRPFDRNLAETAAGNWFWDDMEECPECGDYVPYDELEGLIDTLPICFPCRKKRKEELLGNLMMDGLGLA